MRTSVLVAAVVSLFVASPVAAAPEVELEFDGWLSRAERCGFSGGVLVARGDEPVFAKGYGFARRGTAEPNTPETLFDIASLTKQFTDALVLRLEAKGSLRTMDAPGECSRPFSTTQHGEGDPVRGRGDRLRGRGTRPSRARVRIEAARARRVPVGFQSPRGSPGDTRLEGCGGLLRLLLQGEPGFHFQRRGGKIVGLEVAGVRLLRR